MSMLAIVCVLLIISDTKSDPLIVSRDRDQLSHQHQDHY